MLLENVHDKIWGEMRTAPRITEHYSDQGPVSNDFGKVLKVDILSSNQLAKHRDSRCWYAKVQLWFRSHGISINLPLLSQYRLDCPYVNMTKVVKKYSDPN